MGNNKSQKEKKQKAWNIKQNIINEINWIDDEEIYFIVMHIKHKCKNFTLFVSQQQFETK